MAYVNLLAKIESELNQTAEQLKKASDAAKSDLIEKKNRLHFLALDYLRIEGQYKELAGLNGIY